MIGKKICLGFFFHERSFAIYANLVSIMQEHFFRDLLRTLKSSSYLGDVIIQCGSNAQGDEARGIWSDFAVKKLKSTDVRSLILYYKALTDPDNIELIIDMESRVISN